MYSPSLQKLIDLFSRFPGVGPKTAARFVFYLLGAGRKETEELAEKIAKIKQDLKTCRFCFKSFEATKQGELCEICSDARRNQSLLCVVANETDLATIERAKVFQGFYFILGGTASSLKDEEINKLRVKELIQRIQAPVKFGLVKANFKEIILGLNPTLEGEATTLLLQRKLAGLHKKITRLGRGLPMGGELEYSDRETLCSAFKGREEKRVSN